MVARTRTLSRGAMGVLLLALLAGIGSPLWAQAFERNSLTVSRSPAELDCSTPDITLATLDLQKWYTYTFFWVGTQMPPSQLSLGFCDNAGNPLREGAGIMRGALALEHEVDGFMALEDLPGVSVRLHAEETLQPGDYVMRLWVFASSSEERSFAFPSGHSQVTACGNETSDFNGVAVDVYGGQANEFAGNALVGRLALCERIDLSYVVPATAPQGLRRSDDVVHVFHARPQEASAAGSAGGGAQADDAPGFTVTSYTPGRVRYSLEEVESTAETAGTAETEDAASGAQAVEFPVIADYPFAMLGSIAGLHHVSFADGGRAVDVIGIGADGNLATLIRVNQEQVDAIDYGLVAVSDDNRVAVSVSSLDIITFAVGPDDSGRVHYLEFSQGLNGPISASGSSSGGPPGEAWSR